jgi:ABC-2 type transport system permease protein
MGAIEGSGDINTMIDLYGEMFGNLKNNFIKFYPISGWLLDGLNGDILKYLLYIGVMVIPFAVLVLFVGKNFLKANMNAKISYSAKDFKIQEQKQNGKIKALLKRDVKRFFSSSVQVLNIGIGPILSTIILVVMVINTKSAMESEGVAKDFIKSFMPVISILTVGFTFGIMPSTSSSISLEGKNFWILKSAPIETKDVLCFSTL